MLWEVRLPCLFLQLMPFSRRPLQKLLLMMLFRVSRQLRKRAMSVLEWLFLLGRFQLQHSPRWQRVAVK